MYFPAVFPSLYTQEPITWRTRRTLLAINPGSRARGLVGAALTNRKESGMSVKSFAQIKAEADQLIRVWDANPIFSLGDVTLPEFQSMVASFKDARSRTDGLRT